MAQTTSDTAGQTPAEPGALSPAAAKMAQKVELDLDDAPFLQEENPPEPEKEPAAKAAEPQEEAPAPPPKKSALKERLLLLKDRLLSNKKRLVIAGASAVLLLGGGIAVNSFLFGAPAPKRAAAPEPRKVVVPDAPAPLPAAPVSQYTLRWDPFWVEQKDSEGATRFLICRFAIPTDNATLYAEMQQKKIILRDAFFYYLRNLPLTPLNTEATTRKLKQELMTVVNEHVGSGKVEDIYIEEYLIK